MAETSYIENFTPASQMVRKVAFSSNLQCRIVGHPPSSPSYVRGSAPLVLGGRPHSSKTLDHSSTRNHPLQKTQLEFDSFYTEFCSTTTQETTPTIREFQTPLLGLHETIESSITSRDSQKLVHLPNKRSHFQFRGGLSNGTIRLTCYNSHGFVSCNFDFHVADPILTTTVVNDTLNLTNYVILDSNLYQNHLFHIINKISTQINKIYRK